MATDSGYQVSGNAAENYERFVGVFMTPWAERLVATAALHSGERVLDLACGTGFVARTASAVVGEHGHVVGVDLNPQMLDVARTIGGFDVIDASADSTGLDTGSFDAVLCQQGLQYFPDPSAAIAESARCLRPGGRALFSVWAPFTENPLIANQADALEPYLDPDAIAAFRGTNVDSLAGPDGVADLLTSAGFSDVEIRTEQLTIELPAMATYFPDLISATPWAPTFAELSTDQRQTVIEHMERAATPLHDGPGCSTQMTAVIASGVTQ